MIAIALAVAGKAATPNCQALATLSLSKAFVHVEEVTGGEFVPSGGKAISNLPAFCRLEQTLTPTTDSHIQVEIWLPLEHWNGKLQGEGNGGYAGSVNYDGLAAALRSNYAAVATDTGHQAGAEDAGWALNHPEKIVDFGYRAIHLMTADAKQVVQAFYGTPVKLAYFNSCSNGGRQALMEAQRFPDDYNGIVAGAPANYWTHLLGNAVVNSQALLKTKSSYIPPSKLPAIQAAVQQACDLNDHVKDNIIENPARCHFDTSILLCKGEDSDTCLTAEQLTALNQIYAGGHFSNGESFFPGYPPGGEAAKGNWDAWITGPAPGKGYMYAYGTQFFKNMVYNNPEWDFLTFQADRDVKAADDKVAPILNSNSPDLSAFVAGGGKLILYHGWDDAAIAAPNTVNYFEAVRKRIGAVEVSKSIRLFMVPGMQHCFGGNGASGFGQFGAGAGDPAHDIDAALVQWVEKGIAPEQLIAEKPRTQMTHLLCAYPATAHYSGHGDTALAASYSCSY
jgi:hypothetical protein